MKYGDGREAQLGDRVKLGGDEDGVVVASLDTDEFSANYPKAEWGYLRRGILVEFPLYGVIHYEQSGAELELIARATGS